MKILILLAVLLGGCTSIQITPDGVAYEGLRKVSISHEGTVVISGEVLLNQESVQVLAREAAAVAEKDK